MITLPDFQKKQIAVVFFNEGEKMAIHNDNFVVRDKEGKIKLQCTCYRLFLVFAVGQFSITSAVIQNTKKYGFFIACVSATFRLNSIIGDGKEGNTLIKKKQYGYSGASIARQIVRNKLMNQRLQLMRVRYKNEAIKECISAIDRYLDALQEELTLNELMAYEGLAAKQYFKNHFNNVLWQGRQPRLKRDYVNTVLDLGYSLLFTFVDCIAQCFGFDTYVGVLHQQFYLRKSLVCDLVEPFRVIIDAQIKKALNLRQIKEDDCVLLNHRYAVKYECSAKYAKLFMTAILDHRDDIFSYIRQFYIAFMKDKPGDEFPIFLWEGTS